MNIDLLKAFVTLARSDTYRSAAEALFITQSALTKKIYRLESDIGATLFDRNRGGTKLSIVGECLLPEAKRVIASAEKFDQLSNQVAAGNPVILMLASVFRVLTLHLDISPSSSSVSAMSMSRLTISHLRHRQSNVQLRTSEHRSMYTTYV